MRHSGVFTVLISLQVAPESQKTGLRPSASAEPMSVNDRFSKESTTLNLRRAKSTSTTGSQEEESEWFVVDMITPYGGVGEGGTGEGLSLGSSSRT